LLRVGLAYVQNRRVKQVLKPQVPDLSKLDDIGEMFGAGV
jgi:hypothetical protein